MRYLPSDMDEDLRRIVVEHFRLIRFRHLAGAVMFWLLGAGVAIAGYIERTRKHATDAPIVTAVIAVAVILVSLLWVIPMLRAQRGMAHPDQIPPGRELALGIKIQQQDVREVRVTALSIPLKRYYWVELHTEHGETLALAALPEHLERTQAVFAKLGRAGRRAI